MIHAATTVENLPARRSMLDDDSDYPSVEVVMEERFDNVPMIGAIGGFLRRKRELLVHVDIDTAPHRAYFFQKLSVPWFAGIGSGVRREYASSFYPN